MKYIYIDNEIGNDETGNGSKKKPYKTLRKYESTLNKNLTCRIWREGSGELFFEKEVKT